MGGPLSNLLYSESSMSNTSTVSPGIGTSVGVSGSGSLLNMSAFPLCCPGLYSML